MIHFFGNETTTVFAVQAKEELSAETISKLNWLFNSELVSESQQLVSESQQLVSESQQLVSESQQLVSESQHLVSESQHLVSESQHLVSDSQINKPKSVLTDFFVGPRAAMITPWSTNAVEITQNMGIEGIIRIEEFQKITEEFSDFDPMLSQKYTELHQDIFTINIQPEAIIEIDDIAKYNKQEGLSLRHVDQQKNP